MSDECGEALNEIVRLTMMPGSLEWAIQNVVMVPGVLMAKGLDYTDRGYVRILVYGEPEPEALATAILNGLPAYVSTRGDCECRVMGTTVRWSVLDDPGATLAALHGGE